MKVAVRFLVALSLAVGVALGVSAAARADVYWVNTGNDTIGRSPLSGTPANQSFVSAGDTTGGGVAADATYLYWSLWDGSIVRAPLATPQLPVTIVPGAGTATQLALDAAHVYWTDPNSPRIGRADLDGANANASWIDVGAIGGGSPDGVAVDGTYVYWADANLGTIGRARLDGSDPDPDFIAGLTTPRSVTLDATHLYWGDSGAAAVGRANLDGSSPEADWLHVGTPVIGVDVAGGRLYWSEPMFGTIGRVDLADEDDFDESFIAGANFPQGIVVTAPGFAAGPSSHAYGNVSIGSTTSQTFTISNDESGPTGLPLTFAAGAVTVTGGSASQFQISADTCSGTTVAPGAACGVTVDFQPTSAGIKSATLRFADDASSSPQTVALSGVAGVVVTSVRAQNRYYTAGSVLRVTVSFSENVEVTGTPTLSLDLDDGPVAATYASGSGTRDLVFEYTVQDGDSSSDGPLRELDYTSTSALSLAGGAIRDGAGDNAVLTLPQPGGAGSLVGTSQVLVDAIRPTVVGFSTVPDPRTYAAGDSLIFEVELSEPVSVSGFPTFPFTLGSATRQAMFVGNSGQFLIFIYNVQPGDVALGGIEIAPGTAISIPGNSSIHDAPDNQLVPELNNIPALDDVHVYGASPSVTSVSAAAGVHSDTIDVTVGFGDHNVTVNGTPCLPLEVGGSSVCADYVSGSGSGELLFRYELQPGDTDDDGVEFGSALMLQGGTIEGELNDAANLSIAPRLAPQGVFVDTTAPSVDAVSVPAGVYGPGDVIRATVELSEAVDVTGTPTLQLETGNANGSATYVSGSGSDALLFEYTVQPGDTSSALDYESTSSLTLAGGTIRDAGGNDADLTLPAPGDSGSISGSTTAVIDAVAPRATAIERLDANPTSGGSVRWRVTFSEPVDGVTAGDFRLVAGGDASGVIAAMSATDAQTYEVRADDVTGGAAGGTLGLDLVAAGAGVADLAGNALEGGLAGEVYEVEPKGTDPGDRGPGDADPGGRDPSPPNPGSQPPSTPGDQQPPAGSDTTPPPPPARRTVRPRPPAIERFTLGQRCVRPSRAGTVRFGLRLRLTQAARVRIEIARGIGTGALERCPARGSRGTFGGQFAPAGAFTRGSAKASAVRTVAATASLTRSYTLTPRLKPGLYRITASVYTGLHSLGRPVHRFLRVLAR